MEVLSVNEIWRVVIERIAHSWIHLFRKMNRRIKSCTLPPVAEYSAVMCSIFGLLHVTDDT